MYKLIEFFNFEKIDGKVNTTYSNYTFGSKSHSYNTNYNVTSIYKEK